MLYHNNECCYMTYMCLSYLIWMEQIIWRLKISPHQHQLSTPSHGVLHTVVHHYTAYPRWSKHQTAQWESIL